MGELHLQNIPNEVVHRLERLARAEGVTVAAIAIRELDAASRRVDNARLLAELPDLDLPTGAIVDAVWTERR